MQSSALEYLRCPECREHLSIHHTAKRNGDIRSGSMNCVKCDNQYPIILGRPALLPNMAVNTWQAPVDEVLGVPPGTPVNGLLSMNRLKEIGIDRAIDELSDRSTNTEVVESDLYAGHEHFISAAEKTGFSVISTEAFEGTRGTKRITVFRKT